MSVYGIIRGGTAHRRRSVELGRAALSVTTSPIDEEKREATETTLGRLDLEVDHLRRMRPQ